MKRLLCLLVMAACILSASAALADGLVADSLPGMCKQQGYSEQITQIIMDSLDTTASRDQCILACDQFPHMNIMGPTGEELIIAGPESIEALLDNPMAGGPYLQCVRACRDVYGLR